VRRSASIGAWAGALGVGAEQPADGRAGPVATPESSVGVVPAVVAPIVVPVVPPTVVPDDDAPVVGELSVDTDDEHAPIVSASTTAVANATAPGLVPLIPIAAPHAASGAVRHSSRRPPPVLIRGTLRHRRRWPRAAPERLLTIRGGGRRTGRPRGYVAGRGCQMAR
jgi:hypothetical protein